VSYIVESGASSSRRARRRRALITLTIVVLMLFFAFWYAYSYYRASSERTAAPPAACPSPTAASAPQPRSITVNVYNATNRTGLAARIATEVRTRGFKVATVANDPLQKTITGPAEVRYGKAAKPSSTVVLGLVKGARAVQDGRADASVDLVLGEKFTALAPRAKAPTTPDVAATTPAGAGGATSGTSGC
jgi:hypothetical protein